MDNPVTENQIRDVVRSITEPPEAGTILANLDKYFSEDAFIVHPLIIQPEFARGKEFLKGIYKWFRVGTINNKITFHAVMFNEEKTQCALELTEYVELRPFPMSYCSPQNIRFLVRVDLRLERDGKYRICRQHDNVISSALGSLIPGFGLNMLSDLVRGLGGCWIACLGILMIKKGWGGK